MADVSRLLEAARRPEVEAGFKAAAPFLRRELASRFALYELLATPTSKAKIAE